MSLDTELRAALGADLVEFGEGTRAIYATDSSNYRQIPIGVIFPRTAEDVVAALKVCAEHDVPVLGRGAGTSLAGQACNAAVIFDFSRHMNQILEIDPEARTARVQPGVVLDDLRRAAEAHGLTFGPDPATHAWCTLGGMIGNNSCGTHALYAGKTVDNVLRLRVACYGGGEFEFGEYDDAAYAALVRSGAPEAGILGSLREIGRRHADLVRER
jgi:FAD/FMN-containing dehydrogenase